jgi:hypothetical protein
MVEITHNIIKYSKLYTLNPKYLTHYYAIHFIDIMLSECLRF